MTVRDPRRRHFESSPSLTASFGDRCEEDPFESHTTVTPPIRALVQRTLLTYQSLALSLSLKVGVDGGGPDHCNSLPILHVLKLLLALSLLPVLKPLLALSELRGEECAMFTARDGDIAALARVDEAREP